MGPRRPGISPDASVVHGRPDVALLLFDCSDPNDPFARALLGQGLKKHAPPTPGSSSSRPLRRQPNNGGSPNVNQTLRSTLDEYFKTSAKTGEGVEQIFHRLLSEIPWDNFRGQAHPSCSRWCASFCSSASRPREPARHGEVGHAAAARFHRPGRQAGGVGHGGPIVAEPGTGPPAGASPGSPCVLLSRSVSTNTALRLSQRPAKGVSVPCRSGTIDRSIAFTALSAYAGRRDAGARRHRGTLIA